MSKTDTNNILECWSILSEYIPAKEMKDASEHLITYFQSILSTTEMLELVEQDDDLLAAYEEIVEPELDVELDEED